MVCISAKNIHVYDSAYKLIDDNTTAAEWDAVLQALPTEEERDVFENLEDDYETYNYLLLDYEHVIMVFDSDVMEEWDTVSAFIQDTIKEVKYAVYGEDEEI